MYGDGEEDFSVRREVKILFMENHSAQLQMQLAVARAEKMRQEPLSLQPQMVEHENCLVFANNNLDQNLKFAVDTSKDEFVSKRDEWWEMERISQVEYSVFCCYLFFLVSSYRIARGLVLSVSRLISTLNYGGSLMDINKVYNCTKIKKIR